MNALPLSRPFFLARLTIGHWLLLLFAVALVSWGAAFHHNARQIGLLGAGLLLYWAARRLSTEARQNALKLAALAGMALVFGEWVLAGFARPAWPMNPNALAGLLLLTLPATGLIALPFLLITESRAALVPAFFYGWHAITARPRGLLLGSVMALAVGAGLVLWRPATVDARLRVWQEAVEIWQRKPLWGVGYGNYAYYSRVERPKLHADSLPLTFLAEMGVVGGGAALFAVGGVAWRVWQAPARPALKLGLALWAVQQLADHTGADAVVLAVLMVTLAEIDD